MPEPQDSWDEIKNTCDQNIEQLGDYHNINNDQNEGVLFSRGRELYILNPADGDILRLADGDILGFAAVAEENLDNEVGLSYALFNGRQNPVGPYQIISWESPLLRPTQNGLGVRRVRCDLVAYDAKTKQLVAVEVKINPDNPDTQIQHGMLQSMAYGYLLQHSLNADPDGLRRQVQMCLNEWCGQNNDELPEIDNVACALAAPKEYFRESLTLNGELNGELVEWLNRAINIEDSRFSNFWVIEYDGVNAVQVNENTYIPQTEYRITFCSNVQELANHCL